jgi:site-specific DNA-methyltransferase (adenine-specific)
MSERVRLIQGDCRVVLADLAKTGVRFDGCVTDPPYHLTSIVDRFGKEGAAETKAKGATGVYKRSAAGFMGQSWDGGDIAFQPETWAAVKAVLKPGAYLCAFASTRGYHRMVCAIEDAGFIIHPMLAWLFGSGFPKATRLKLPDTEHLRYGLQALKPALEPICLAQVPMEGTGTANWLKHGVGALDIDVGRVGDFRWTKTAPPPELNRPPRAGIYAQDDWTQNWIANRGPTESKTPGRWPANVVHDGSEEVLAAFARAGERGGGGRDSRGRVHQAFTDDARKSTRDDVHAGFDDAGSAARFFYSAKARDEDRFGSKHPTVKPVDLIRWLVELTIPRGGELVDPFAGSGTAAAAAYASSRRATVIEQQPEFAEDIKARIAWLEGRGGHSARERNRRMEKSADGPLFGDAPPASGGGASGLQRLRKRQLGPNGMRR